MQDSTLKSTTTSNQFSHVVVDPLNTKWQPRVNLRTYPAPIVHPAILESNPRLLRILSSIGKPTNLYWETWPPDLAARQWEWTRFDLWSEASQAAFDRLWPPEGDDWIDSLIDVYGSNWHNALPLVADRDQSELVRRLQSPSEAAGIVFPAYLRNNSDFSHGLALRYGPWVRTARRRSWIFPSPGWCDLCGAGYYADTIRYYLLRRWGGAGLCPRCLALASLGLAPDSPLYTPANADEAIDALRALAAAAQVIPPQAFRESLSHPGLDPATRARLAAALICVPEAQMIRKTLGGVPWLKVLQLAQLVGEAWRPARGTLCTAADGHPCRSLAERSIDDWLSRHAIAHDVEPAWPRENDLNPGGRLRADWRLPDGTLLEYAGLDNADYNSKIELKRRLASKTRTTLLIIFPEDLLRLETVLGPWKR